MKRLRVFFMAVVVAVMVAPCFGFAQETIRQLTPRPDSATAMTNCGAELEAVKAQNQTTRQYVFTGQEVVRNMRYCVTESATSVVDTKNEYRITAGSVGWLSEDGSKVVLEGCVNDATCENCPPALLKPEPAPERVALPPIVVELPSCNCDESVVMPIAQLGLEPEPIVLVALDESRTVISQLSKPVDFAPDKVTIIWESGRPLWSKFSVLNCVYQFGPGIGRHGLGDIVEKAGCAAGAYFSIASLTRPSAPAPTILVEGTKVVPPGGVISPP